MLKKRPRTSKEMKAMYPKLRQKYCLLVKIPVSARCNPYSFVCNPDRPRRAIYSAKTHIGRILDDVIKWKMWKGRKVYKTLPNLLEFQLRMKSPKSLLKTVSIFTVNINTGKVSLRSGHKLMGYTEPLKKIEELV